MTNSQYKEIIDFMYMNDCWFEYACEYFGYSKKTASQAEERFDNELKKFTGKTQETDIDREIQKILES